MSCEEVTFGRSYLEDDRLSSSGPTFAADSPTVELLDRLEGPLMHNNFTRTWIASLDQPSGLSGDYTQILLVNAPNSSGWGEHEHPNYEERFQVIEGEFLLVVDGDRYFCEPGDEYVIPPGTPHYYQNWTSDYTTCVIENRPPSELQRVFATLAGISHDYLRARIKGPVFLQWVALAPLLRNEVKFTDRPRGLKQPYRSLLASYARWKGYQQVYHEYFTNEYWEDTIEQIPDGGDDEAAWTWVGR
jgi:quercetin dioxygenase-like cupin family protein